MKFFISTLLLFLFTFSTIFAQDQSVEMADAMRADGKIYVVVATLGLVLAGIIFYLIQCCFAV
jgi:hypothetical protein